MENKFQTYIRFFAINVILYCITFNFLGLIDTFVTIFFFASSIWLVFTLEEKVENYDTLKNPMVHEYSTSRLNNYGYMMAGNFMILSFLFYLITFNFNVRYGFISLILWGLFIISTFYISKLSSKYLEVDMITDYLSIKLKNDSINKNELRSLVKNLYSNKLREDNLIKKELKRTNWTTEEKNQFTKEYLTYINSNFNEPLVSDEIKEINKG